MSRVDPNWYALRNAVFERRYDAASALLAAQPSLLRLTNGIGETVLHYVAVENDLEGVAWLRARGADLDVRNGFGTPVLFEVALLQYRDLFRWFMQQGADGRATDADGNQVVDYLRARHKPAMAEWVQQEFPAGWNPGSGAAA